MLSYYYSASSSAGFCDMLQCKCCCRLSCILERSLLLMRLPHMQVASICADRRQQQCTSENVLKHEHPCGINLYTYEPCTHQAFRKIYEDRNIISEVERHQRLVQTCDSSACKRLCIETVLQPHSVKSVHVCTFESNAGA